MRVLNSWAKQKPHAKPEAQSLLLPKASMQPDIPLLRKATVMIRASLLGFEVCLAEGKS